MKISDLMLRLAQLQQDFGDLEVMVTGYEGGVQTPGVVDVQRVWRIAEHPDLFGTHIDDELYVPPGTPAEVMVVIPR